MDFPSNSHTQKDPEPKATRERAKRVTSGEAVKRRKPLGKQFKETFVGGDFRSATQYVIFDVMVPSVRDMMFDAFTEGMQRLIFGDTRRRGGYGGGYRPSEGPPHISYNSFSKNRYERPPEPRSMSRRGRARHDFGEIVISSRSEGEDVIDSMFEMLSKFDVVSVADLYGMVGLESNHVDENWGWENLQGAGVMKVRGGYLLDLPEPQSLIK